MGSSSKWFTITLHWRFRHTHKHHITDSVWKLVLGAGRELIFQSGRSKNHHLPPLYKEFTSHPLLKTFSIQIVLSVFPALLMSPSLLFIPDDDDDDDSFTGLSITWCRRQEIMPGQSLKDTSAAGRFHLWRCSRERFPPSTLSSSKVLFEGALSAVYTLLFFSFKWGLYRVCVRRLRASKREWRHLLWPITSSLDTSNLTSGISKHYKTDQLGSWILISWCNAHSVVLAKRHCLQCEGLFSLLTIFSQHCFVAENFYFLLVQWLKSLIIKIHFF